MLFVSLSLLLSPSIPLSLPQVNIASDEEVIEFDSPLGPKTWTFLIREKKLKGGIIISSLITGVVGGCCVYYIRPSTTYHLGPVRGGKGRRGEGGKRNGRNE